jgi:hypothetical protein
VARLHYPVRVRIDYSPRSSRGWAVLTITLVKFVVLLPHALALFFLGLAGLVAFVIAQVVVVARGTYPRPLFDFVTGVLRWQTRVYAFAFSLTDVYPPFSLEPVSHYPVDLEIVYPQRSNPWLASFTVAALIFWLAVVLPLGWGGYGTAPFQPLDWLSNVRLIVLLPHYVVLFFYFLAALVVFAVGQVMILIGGYLPLGLHAFMAGWLRWMVRTWAWLYGLVDTYPPFTTEDTELSG